MADNEPHELDVTAIAQVFVDRVAQELENGDVQGVQMKLLPSLKKIKVTESLFFKIFISNKVYRALWDLSFQESRDSSRQNSP